jgi:hypothetical protein
MPAQPETSGQAQTSVSGTEANAPIIAVSEQNAITDRISRRDTIEVEQLLQPIHLTADSADGADKNQGSPSAH